ncbi:helix-turn-helix transcriptional regulator [Sphingomonas sp. RT2P30]|uniref:helix-turn-helix domain-containing protein n=1 Tax=Parasphingomonas halimpatiens TaxID=3096162 RepID=UPI002FCAA5E1
MTMVEQAAPNDLTPRHVRAARALLAWSQQDLAKAANVATSTIADFERGQRTPVANNAQAIRKALEENDIRFLPTGAVIGPDIPVIGPQAKTGMPIRWVTGEDLSNWANMNDAVHSLPTLISHLIQSTTGASIRVEFRADEGVRYGGWDGLSRSSAATAYVPQGDAGWELGTQRTAIAGKANEDYRKRSDDPSPLDPANTTFMFVTPRHWKDKAKWEKARRQEGRWRDVRVYDADDLVHWIELTPAVGLWLATRLRKFQEGMQTLEQAWEEWSRATARPLSADLVLSDRDREEAEVLQWLRGEPSVLSLQATTAEEVVAFFHATLGELPDDVAARYRTRCIVTLTHQAARALAEASGPLIIVMTDPHPGLAKTLAAKGHFVLQAYDERVLAQGEMRALARPSRAGIARALEQSGTPRARAETLARDSARNLAVLRRLMPSAPDTLPSWATEKPPQALIAALLAGGWEEENEADKAQLEQLAEQPYDELIAVLMPYVGAFDSPLQKAGSAWRVASPADAWVLLARYFAPADIRRFEAVARTVLSTSDPRFDLPPDRRWLAAIEGVRREYSGLLRHGVGQVLIQLALWGGNAAAVPDAGRRAEAIVAELLGKADQQRWWSLSRDFRLLAEAAPNAFLSAIEESLDANDPAIAILFGTDEGGLHGAEYLSDLMWALEALAWSPQLLPRVSHVLARLDALDTKPRRWANGPAHSLREINLLWIPQTYATLDQRLRALDAMRRQEPDTAWKIMLGILPSGHDSAMPTSHPRWRDFTVDQEEDITFGLIARGATELTRRLVADVGISSTRWISLLDRLNDLAPDGNAAIDALEHLPAMLADNAERMTLWDKLRRLLHHHRQFATSDWALPAEVLDRIEAVYEQLAPADPVERIAWLFGAGVALARPTGGWESEDRDIDSARRAAAGTLYDASGIPAILQLGRAATYPGFVGKALYENGLDAAQLDALIEASLRSGDASERGVALGLIVNALHEHGEDWVAPLIERMQRENWGEDAVMTVFRALPSRTSTWNRAAALGQRIEDMYWAQIPTFWLGEEDDAAFAIQKLIAAGRAKEALGLADHAKKKVPTILLIKVLRQAANQWPGDGAENNDVVMFQHHVAEIFSALDERDDVDEKEFARLEWEYLALLEHSQRPAKVLIKALSEQPALFVDMLKAVFKPSEDSGVVEPEPDNQDQVRAMAHQAYRLLGLWDRLPGTRDDGGIDGELLNGWIEEARKLAIAAGRADMADSRIGTMLSASPLGGDGNWPAEPVRDALDHYHSAAMLDGFSIGKSNRRGVTMRMPGDGGRLERLEAAQYRRWAEAIIYDHPYTAKALTQLAESYDDRARREDEEAEQRDWQY